jgi:hypothetical protein
MSHSIGFQRKRERTRCSTIRSGRRIERSQAIDTRAESNLFASNFSFTFSLERQPRDPSNSSCSFGSSCLFRCVIDFPPIKFSIPPEVVFTYYGFLLGFLLPVSMITSFYVLVLVRLSRIRHTHKSEFKQRSHRKVTRIVLAVITAYFICWVPYWLLQIFITIDPLIDSLRMNSSMLPVNGSMRFLKELTHLTTIIGYANNCLNPVLYVFLSESFREEYLIVLNCFHPACVFAQHASQPDTRRRRRRRRRRPPTPFDLADDLPAKKIKHTLAIGDLPSHYRLLTPLRRFNEQPRYSSDACRTEHADGPLTNSIGLKPIACRTEPTNRHLSTSTLDNCRRTTLTMNSTVGGTAASSSMIIDDGGVYCGN